MAEVSYFEVEEGNQANLETYKLAWHAPHLYCIPLVGVFAVCSLENLEAPKLFSCTIESEEVLRG